MMKAKAYKIELLVLDFEDISQEEIIYLIESIKYVDPTVMSIQSKEIDEWDDEHPLNKLDTMKQTYDEMFG
jgi:hypothetical protein